MARKAEFIMKKRWSRCAVKGISNCRFLIRNAGTKFMYLVGFITLAFLVTWFYRTSIGKNDYPIDVENRYHEILANFTFLTLEHAKALKNGFGRRIIVEFLNTSSEGEAENGIMVDMVEPTFPKQINADGIRFNKVPSEKTAGYIRVWKYWEQLTMNTFALITLAGQAKIAHRKVVVPRVENSFFGQIFTNALATYFNITAFNNILATSGYATLVGEKDYEAQCPLADAGHVVIHFVYEGGKKEDVEVISKLEGTTGWAECPNLRNSTDEPSHAKFFCVDADKVIDWNKLENEVIRGARCVTITNWRGTGRSYRTHFSENHLPVEPLNLIYALKPSGHILKEVNRIRRVFDGSYIGVHVRAEKIFRTHNVSRVLDCARLVAELVRFLKAVSAIKHVVIASDTSSFGSYAWEGQEKHRIMKNLHSTLVSSIGGIEYEPTAGYLDRGVVALVEMNLLARAKHLIAVGRGSFQEWIIAKFLEQHRNEQQSSWSLVKTCSG